MNRRAAACGLKRLAELRGLQVALAEGEAARAVAAARAAAERRSEGAGELAQTQDGWRASLGAGAFDPDLARHWAGAVSSAQARLAELDEAQAAAESDARTAAEARHAAQARRDVASGRARKAARAAESARDEARSVETAERLAARRRR